MGVSVAGSAAFYAMAGLALVGASWVAFSRNIVRSAFALLATFLGVAGLYASLSADLVAVIQLLVYVGGVLIVILFAVMLTTRIADVHLSNRSVGLAPGFALLLPVTAALVWIAGAIPTARIQVARSSLPTAPSIGDALLGAYVLPFEVVSVLLFAALVGAVVLARGWGTRPPPRTPAENGTPEEKP
jgi:NAD(P)H-quinone oxidoreductase subunit 6